MCKKLLLLTFAILLFYSQTFAHIYVAKTGSDSNSGTLASPYLTTQKAADVEIITDPLSSKLIVTKILK